MTVRKQAHEMLWLCEECELKPINCSTVISSVCGHKRKVTDVVVACWCLLGCGVFFFSV